jgi:hypothetical protein
VISKEAYWTMLLASNLGWAVGTVIYHLMNR